MKDTCSIMLASSVVIECCCCCLQVGNLLSQSPDLSFPISTDAAQTWLLTTYLDENTRITRGDGGSVFVLVKDVATSTTQHHMSAEQEAVAEAMML